MTALDVTAHWPVTNVSAGILSGDTVAATIGDTTSIFALASVTKPLVAWALLVATEEGVLELDAEIEGIGQPDCTLRHLLSHAGGFPFDGRTPIARPERSRGYSNSGIEIAAEVLEHATAIPIAQYLDEAVLQPLDMSRTHLTGSPAQGASGCVVDLLAFIAEIRSPSLISTATRDAAFTSTYPDLSGIVPGVGRYAPCPWGLGFEIRGDKSPHWTGQHNSARTVGHFGGAGTMFWFDPEADLGLVALSDRSFGDWALEAWPALSDAVIAEHSR
jgi:CubicO group peptidase (beta-lactamase class C family)